MQRNTRSFIALFLAAIILVPLYGYVKATVPAESTIRAYWTAEQKEHFFYLCALLTATVSLAIILYQKLFLNNQLNDPAEVKLLTGFPLLGTIPHLNRKTAKLLIPHQHNPLAESLRLIRINLHIKNKGLPNQVLLVTSHLKSEGKTFFSLNLGVSLSAVNKKVVVLEFNLQESEQYEKTGLKHTSGWSDYLKNGDIHAEGLIQKSNRANNLFIIRCGHSFVNAVTALQNPRTKQLIRELKSRFDYIILDGAVTTGTPDALGLSIYVDTAIFVLRRNFTNRLQLDMLKKACLKSQTRNPMVIFNDVKPRSLFDFL